MSVETSPLPGGMDVRERAAACGPRADPCPLLPSGAGASMKMQAKALDVRALGAGAVVSLGAVIAGLLGVVGHNLVFFAPAVSAGEGIGAVLTEGLIFLGILIVGLPVATFVSIWRSRAAALTQGTAAVLLDWALAFGVGGGALTALPGGSADIFELFFMLSPAFLACQVVAGAVAWLVTRVGLRSDHSG